MLKKARASKSVSRDTTTTVKKAREKAREKARDKARAKKKKHVNQSP